MPDLEAGGSRGGNSTADQLVQELYAELLQPSSGMLGLSARLVSEATK
jgi:hypothetical protein